MRYRGYFLDAVSASVPFHQFLFPGNHHASPILGGMLTASGTPPAFAARRDIDHGSELVRVQTEGSKPAFGPCQVQPAPTAPPRPARAGGPRGDAICQARLRLTDQRRRAWSAGAGHHVSVSGRPSRSRHRRCNRAHLLHSLIQIVFLDHSAARHTAAAKFRRPSVARGVTDSPSDDARPSPSVQWVALKLFLPVRHSSCIEFQVRPAA